MWISMIFTSSLIHVLSYIFWKFDQNLLVGFLLINLWQRYQIFWEILAPNDYQNRHFLQFVHIDRIFNLFLGVPIIHILISHNKILPSSTARFTEWHQRCRISADLSKICIFQELIFFNPDSETVIFFAFSLWWINKNHMLKQWKTKYLWIAFICP